YRHRRHARTARAARRHARRGLDRTWQLTHGPGSDRALPLMTPLRILIVDDHAVVRRGVRALLESQPGWQVAGEATTGREAVDLAKRLYPDIVVMDLSLPELNGLDAARQILKDSPRTEILVLTMHHSEELVRNVLQAGARGYVLKSDADESLIAAVESLRDHKPILTSP